MNLKDLLTDPFENKPKRQVSQAFLDSDKTSSRFTEEQRRFFISLMGQYMNGTEIAEEMKKKYGIDIKYPTQMMRAYGRAKKWIPIIERMRATYVQNIHEVAGSYKRVRMERRERIYEKALKKDDLKHALIAVKNMEDEMEERGQSGASFNLTLNQYNAMSDEEIDSKRKELIERIQPKVIELKKES